MDWIPFVSSKQARYVRRHRERDERALVRQGNVAYAAALGLLMAGDRAEAARWFRRAAADWRASFDAGAAPNAWGRPVGVVKASLLAGDADAAETYARWTLELGSASAESPIGRYGASLALLVLRRRAAARRVAQSLRSLDTFPGDVATALVAIAEADTARASEAVESVVRSFEDRGDYLEDAAVADTALVLVELARANGLAVRLPPSAVLPL